MVPLKVNAHIESPGATSTFFSWTVKVTCTTFGPSLSTWSNLGRFGGATISWVTLFKLSPSPSFFLSRTDVLPEFLQAEKNITNIRVRKKMAGLLNFCKEKWDC